jgi:hypothetical protein
MSRHKYLWTQDYYDGGTLDLGDLGRWYILEKISEVTRWWHYPPHESVAVYLCQKVTGGELGQKAILKIRSECVCKQIKHHQCHWVVS